MSTSSILHPLLLWLLSLDLASCQTFRTFPPLFNVAKQRPITTEPFGSTCGIPTRNGYCRSSTLVNSIYDCKQNYCVQECPRRTKLPQHGNLLAARNFGPCVTTDTTNMRPGSEGNDFAAIFNDAESCYVIPYSTPVLGANGAFTLTFWVWQNIDNRGTVLEKYTEDTQETIFRVIVSSSRITLAYRTIFGLRETEFTENIPSLTWTHISIQVYDTSVSYFLNGTGPGYAAGGTQGLVGTVQDGPGVYRVGQDAFGEQQYVGKLQDVWFFELTLTNREIMEVYSDTFPEVLIESSCRCPATHPRLKPLDTRFCIRNGVPDNNGDELPRLNNQSHPLPYLNDGDSNSIWVSAFLNDVTIEVDLQDQFQVFYVVLQFYSPQPKVVTIERRKSKEAPWETWQLYAEDCQAAFGQRNNGPLTTATAVNCIQFATNGLYVPYSRGNITFNILSPEPVPRPGHNDFYNTPALADFVQASHVRVRLQDHYYASHPQHKYYGIYEYIVTGRCDCQGHAETCDMSTRPYTCNCAPESNTVGAKCEECKPLYNDKPFHVGDQLSPYNCKPCQCYGHADVCAYDPAADQYPDSHDRGGGGVCVDCKHHTQGNDCGECVTGYYHPADTSMYAEDTCLPCDCYLPGVSKNKTDCQQSGQCDCKSQAVGRRCDKCLAGYFNLREDNFVGCEACGCNSAGTINGDYTCHPTLGQCNCKANVRELRCNQCKFGFHNFDGNNLDGCTACECNPLGSLDQFCDPFTGQCRCKPNIQGLTCDQCVDDFFSFDEGCQNCNCNNEGTMPGSTCDKTTNQCECKANVQGVRCDECRDGFFHLGSDQNAGCTSCGCDNTGTLESSQLCNKTTGDCQCKLSVEGRTCNKCKGNTYNLNRDNPEGCAPCNCDPTGTYQGDLVPQHELTCDQNSGQCTCLTNREGRRCDTCAQDFYVLPVPGGGCQACSCNLVGTVPRSICDPRTGQCQCRSPATGIGGLNCDTCITGWFNFNTRPDTRSCALCACDSAGSLNDTCEPTAGQCLCKEFTTGRQCGTCVPGSSNLQAENPYGCSKVPSQQPPPNYTPLSPTSLRLFWDGPDYPNGVIQTYSLYRDGELIVTLPASDLEYDDTGLTPYTLYTYAVEANNTDGSTMSPTVTYRTPSGAPEGDVSLAVSNIGPRSALFTWTPPTAANGVIARYVLNSVTSLNSSPSLHYEGLALSVFIDDLQPHTNYSFTLSACTAGGCILSGAVIAITKADLPEQQQPPNITATSSTELLVEWAPPIRPNGIIIFYELWMRGMPDESGQRYPVETRIFHPAGQYDPLTTEGPEETPLPPPATTYLVGGLEPFTQYEFQVISENDLGKAASQWTLGRTGETVPLEMPAPDVTAVSSSAFNVTWEEPSERQALGTVQQYRVFVLQYNDLSLNPFAPPSQWLLLHTALMEERWYEADGYSPYSTHSFKVAVCNNVGCVNSTLVNGTTEPDVPSGVIPPEITGFNDTTNMVTWAAPQEPNGPPPTYKLIRQIPSFTNPPPMVGIGTRFPGIGYYKFPPETIPQGVAFTGFDLWFKTKNKDGLLIFAASEGGQEEFVALKLRAGRPWFIFDPQDCEVNVTVDIPDDAAGNVTFNDDAWHHLVVRRQVTSALMILDGGMYTGCPAIVTTTDDEGLPYSDNLWHHLRAIRTGRKGSIKMDNQWTGGNIATVTEGEDVKPSGDSQDSDCTQGNIIGRNTGVYVGGLPDDYVLQRVETDSRAEVERVSFTGCLRDVKILRQNYPEEVWEELDWDTVTGRSVAKPSWEGCPMDLADGILLLGTGFIQFPANKFNGGVRFDMSVKIRTDRTDGLLLYAYGAQGVYWLVQVVAGGLAVQFGNGTHTKNLTNNKVNLCDGKWHAIDVKKDRDNLQITLDKVNSVELTGSPVHLMEVAISSFVWLGGVEPGSEAEESFTSNGIADIIKTSFGGCYKTLKIDKRPYEDSSFFVKTKNIRFDGCPAELNISNPYQCQAVTQEVIYEGQDKVTFDEALLPFTEYMYSLEVSNSAGSVTSEWSSGRTREGVPRLVNRPINVLVISGWVLEANWNPPNATTGMILTYILAAYNLDKPLLPPVQSEFNNSLSKEWETTKLISGGDSSVRGDGGGRGCEVQADATYTIPEHKACKNCWYSEGLIEGVIPYTNYTVKLIACTFTGCAESVDGVNVITSEEAPEDVLAPTALVTGGTYINVGWDMPGYPNGILTGYFLFMEDIELYKGARTSFNVTELNVYTGYRFRVRACGRVGCTDSQFATLSTAQLPPEYVAPPLLMVLGKYRIQANWAHPDQLNGVLGRYLLYQSDDPTENPGELIYNSTDLFLYYIIANLTAGDSYFIRVGACTEGGCTVSEASEATTLESAPEGVPDPVVTSPSPSELLVQWGEPTLPNGEINHFKLFHNGLLIFNSTTVRAYTISGLAPWSLHVLRVEACTERGCGSSNEVSARTQESPPTGNVGLKIRVAGPRSVDVQWNPVDVPNGDIAYDVYFEGLVYVDPDNWDYATMTSRRSLYSSPLASETWLTISGLIPNSQYYVQVNASNTKGFILSNTLEANMPMGSPDGVAPPTLTSPDSSSIRAQWEPVGRPNADRDPSYQLQFRESREGAMVENMFEQPTAANTYLKTDLQPFTSYDFRLLAINSYGETASEWASHLTQEDVPTGIDPPMVTNVTSRSVYLEWQPPYKPNGIITFYRLYANDFRRKQVIGNITAMYIDKLTPFTSYTFKVEVCTVAGCVMSAQSRQVTMLKATPEGIPAPMLVPQSPTIILVVWSEPLHPNGEIMQYLIERRQAGQAEVTIVKSFLPTEPKQFRDESDAIRPHTTYEYRIVAETEAGKGYGPWESVTTRSARPGGVFPPVVTVLDSTSLEISWEPPIQPNGQLTSYIVSLPLPRIEILNTSVMYLLVEDLVPYTNYDVILTACSDGGCTSSIAVPAQTSPALPEGLQPPTGTPHSQNYISILWQAPDRPNGPNMRYELARTKIRQPLAAGSSDFGSWSSIYMGLATYYEDRDLTIFTTYQYRLTVYNDFGYANSEPSSEVTTFGGVPTKPASVSAYSLNHTAIEVRWMEPSVYDMQGGVSEFQLNVSGGGQSLSLRLPAGVTFGHVTSLSPNTEYEAVLTMIMHGGEAITSAPAYTTTTDGAPEGLAQPQLFIIDNTALRVSWMAPSRPNGVIQKYNIYLDGVMVVTDIPQAGSYILEDLEPYTIYSILVEVCTEFACLKSLPTEGTTAESEPAGVAEPSLVVQDANTISVSWNPPAIPNGIILRYDLQKRVLGPCNDNSDPSPVPEEGQCLYFECGILESFCGDQCYSGPKTCCDGVLHDNKPGYECCGVHYIPAKINPTDVCCAGRFQQRLDNHECCGDQYIEVLAGEICCPDPSHNRVAVGPGNQCCEAVPFSDEWPQTCCNGKLHETFGQQCCGGDMVDSSLTCCGDGSDGKAYTSDIDLSCCGEDYVNTSISTCCGGSGNEKVHVYSTPAEKSNANEMCCDSEMISTGLSCCHGNGYNPVYQVCADKSNIDSDCGSGTVCQSTQFSTAFCNRCNFNRNTHKCGSYTPHMLPVVDSTTTIGEPVVPDLNELCLSEPVRIYSGGDFSYIDQGLSPYTVYHYSIEAVNAAGVGRSEYTSVTTLQTLPEGIRPPMAVVEPGRLDTIMLSWEAPQKPNGEILWYIILRDGIEIFRDPLTREHVDRNAIQPYQTYTYTLRVCNSVGCVDSEKVKMATLQAKPEQVQPPLVTPVSWQELQLSWRLPLKPNGFITRYELHLLPSTLLANVSAEVTEYSFTGLQAYTEYTFVLTACTQSGCTNSSENQGQTLQDKPQGLQKPKLVVIDSTSLEIYWAPPEQANGPISVYRLYRTEDAGSAQLIYFSQSMLNYSDSPLIAGTLYSYYVEAENGAGTTQSDISVIRMPLVTPQGIGPPKNVTVRSATSIYVIWDPPSQPNGVIDQYKIVLNAGSADEIEEGVGNVLQYVVNSLDPYTEYSVRIRACLQGVANGCGTGPPVSVRTFEAAPQNMLAPTLIAKGSSIVDISWEPPQNPNGIITQYRVHRRVFGETFEGHLINIVNGDVLGFSNRGADIIPFTEYEYMVFASNSKGETPSPWAMVQTLEAPPLSLDDPSITLIAAQTLGLSWKPPEQTNGIIRMYRLDYRMVYTDPTAQAAVQSVRVAGDVTSSYISGLTPYTPYEVRVVAVNQAGEVASSWVRTTTNQAAPADIGLFDVEKMTNGLAVILRWNAPGQPNGLINNYLVYEEGNVNPTYQGLNRVFEYRKLQPYTNYTVWLEACTLGGCGRSVKQMFTTAEIPPTNQPSPTVTDFNATYVNLQWSPPVNSFGKISKYEVLRRSESLRAKRAVSEPEVVYQEFDTGKSSYEFVDTNLKPFTRYEYMIRATNSKGTAESPWQVVETLQAKPEDLAPPILSHVSAEFDKVLVRWSPPLSPNGILQTYRIQRNDSVPWGFSPSDALEYIDTDLIAYTVYSYTVEACTGGGCTISIPGVIRTPQSKPLYVAAPSVTALDSTSIQVTWYPPQITNGEIKVFHLLVDDETVYSGLDTQYTVNNLVPFQPYMFAVSACTFGGCSQSSAVTGRPHEAAPQDIASPSIIVTGAKSIEITWSPPARPNGIITSYELRRDGSLILATMLQLYVDYLVEAGSTYSYTITAYNSKGSVTSMPSTATTFSSAPEGLAPPKLEAQSSTTILATWNPPIKPNGLIYNYTLLYKQNEPVFSDLQLSTTVTGLDHFTVYSFRVQACTSHGCATSDPNTVRTLEAPPLGLMNPRLTPYADENGAHAGVKVEWSPPRRPNGDTIEYDLHRRNYTGISAGLTGGPLKLLYSGPDEEYLDTDPELLPYTDYEYRVSAFNGEGQAASQWERVRTSEAPPVGVPPPVVKKSTANSITVELADPAVPNGRIENFDVYLNGSLVLKTRSFVVDIESTSQSESIPLRPFTMYSVWMAACTAGGCTTGPAVTERTKAQVPEGVTAPTISNVTATGMEVSWEEPDSPNGVITSYELVIRQSCPYPYADADDMVVLNCTTGVWNRVARGSDVLSASVTGLQPYSRYDLRVLVTNELGTVVNPPFASAITLPAAPVYIESEPLRVTPTGNVLVVDWRRSFQINGEVIRFLLYKDGVEEYAGYATSYRVLWDTFYKEYEFQVLLETMYGTAWSHKVVFNGDDVTTAAPTDSAVAAVADEPFYKELWFIAVLALLVIIILFIGLALCIRSSGHRLTNIRERMPLQSRQKKAPPPSMAYYDGSTDIPHHLPPPPIQVSHVSLPPPHHMDPQVGYTNPAFSSMSAPGSLLDLNLDKMSQRSSEWEEDEDDDDSLLWMEENMPNNDSGLHSLAYGDDYDVDSERPVSVLKEHTMFTDTHL